MRRPIGGAVPLLILALVPGCGFDNVAAPDPPASYGRPCSEANETCGLLNQRQKHWCQVVTGRDCGVLVSDQHPEWRAWVDYRDRPAQIVYWNEIVLQGQEFLITDFRCAHEACHLIQPAVWSEAHRELDANRCAQSYTGERR